VVRATDGLAMGMISPLLPLYFYLRFGVGSEDLAPIYALARFLPLFTFLIVPIVVDRFSSIRCLLAIRLVSGAVVTLFALSSTFPIAGLLFVAYRVLSQFSMPVRQAFATEIVTPAKTGMMIGVSTSARSLLQSIAPTIAGYLYESVSLTIPLFSGAALLATNGVQYPLFYTELHGTADDRE
jgi:MFS family permease